MQEEKDKLLKETQHALKMLKEKETKVNVILGTDQLSPIKNHQLSKIIEEEDDNLEIIENLKIEVKLLKEKIEQMQKDKSSSFEVEKCKDLRVSQEFRDEKHQLILAHKKALEGKD